MRKLILSMALAILSTGAYAQGTPVDNCTASPNNPAIGTPYTYEVITTNNGFSGNGKYHWYITRQKDLLKGQKENSTNDFFEVVNGADKATYNNSSNTVNPLTLTWKPNALTSNEPFYLVIKYTEEKNNCHSSNMKAIKVSPLNNFKLEVTPVKDENGLAFNKGDEKVCAADISSAQILDNGNVRYEYGKTTLYYKVEKKNYVGSWKPTISLPELLGKTGRDAEFIGRKYESVDWKVEGADFKPFSNAFVEGASITNLLAETATTANSFILRVVINNGTYEGIGVDETIALTTVGNMVLADGTSGARDVKDDCTKITSENDNRKGEQIILARPKVEAKSGEFIIQIQ